MSDGLILFAHGARDPAWARPFERIAESARAARPDCAVRLAYLELMAPDLLTAGRQLAEQGCRAVAIVPMFLGAGGHVRRDLPELVARLRIDWPDVKWTLHAPIGEVPAVLAAMTASVLALAGSSA